MKTGLEDGVTPETIRRYYETVAEEWDGWRRRYPHYHAGMRRLVQGMVPPGARILEMGCGTGDLLNALRPVRGVGLNVVDRLTETARNKYRHLEFYTVGVDRVVLPEGFVPDYIVLTNFVDYVHDMWNLAENLSAASSEDTLLIITTNNPLWVPFLRFTSRLGLRMPDPPRNLITNMDIKSVLRLQGFDMVEEGLALPVPVRLPLLGAFLNAILPEIPGFRYSSFLQYIVSRPRRPRPPLSCSVVIPCYNEAENVAHCVEEVPALDGETEIIVVDDGSTDGTSEKVRRLALTDHRVRLITLDENRGKAEAVRAGFRAARGEILIILDADMTVDPESLVKFVKAFRSGTADFINGTRLIYPVSGQAMTFARFLGNKLFCYLASWILRQRVSDTLCGTKALLRRDYERMTQILRDRWGDFSLLFGAAKLRLRIMEIPVHYRARQRGVSKMRILKDGLLFLSVLWQGWKMLRLPATSPSGSEYPSNEK